MKFESLNPQLCKKTEQLLSDIISEQLHCYEVTIVKKHNKPVLKKVKQRFSAKKDKMLVQSQREKNSSVLRLNQIMSKLLTISKCLQLNC